MDIKLDEISENTIKELEYSKMKARIERSIDILDGRKKMTRHEIADIGEMIIGGKKFLYINKQNRNLKQPPLNIYLFQYLISGDDIYVEIDLYPKHTILEFCSGVVLTQIVIPNRPNDEVDIIGIEVQYENLAGEMIHRYECEIEERKRIINKLKVENYDENI